MIGPFTKVPIRVGDDGHADPYIIIQLDQLDRVTKVLVDASRDDDGEGVSPPSRRIRAQSADAFW